MTAVPSLERLRGQNSFGQRIVRRARHELARTEPVVRAIRADPRSRRTRRRIEELRMASRARFRSPDEVLDRIVAEALSSGQRSRRDSGRAHRDSSR
jgi:hypothetical protein